MFYYLSNSSPKSLKWPPFSRMQHACDANIKTDLADWVMGSANNSKWGDEKNTAHTCSPLYVVPSRYWMGEPHGERLEWVTKKRPGVGQGPTTWRVSWASFV